MKYLLFILLNCRFINSLLSYDFEVEMLNSTDPNNTHIVKYSDLIIYRQFKYRGNWKDNLGDWGKFDCVANHKIIKEKGTILKNYCKGKNKDGDIFC